MVALGPPPASLMQGMVVLGWAGSTLACDLQPGRVNKVEHQAFCSFLHLAGHRDLERTVRELRVAFQCAVMRAPSLLSAWIALIAEVAKRLYLAAVKAPSERWSFRRVAYSSFGCLSDRRCPASRFGLAVPHWSHSH